MLAVCLLLFDASVMDSRVMNPRVMNASDNVAVTLLQSREQCYSEALSSADKTVPMCWDQAVCMQDLIRRLSCQEILDRCF